jgi:hypothetical protein
VDAIWCWVGLSAAVGGTLNVWNNGGANIFFVPSSKSLHLFRVLCGYTEDGKALEVRGKGNGGLEEMREHFKDDEPMYGYLRVTAGDEESIRQKFVLISWCGPEVKALKKAKMSVHKVVIFCLLLFHLLLLLIAHLSFFLC